MGLRHARACARTCIRVASVKKYLALAVIATALSASPALAGWTVQKSEADPFAPNGTSTFIAMELGEGSGLSIRCLEGTISLLLVVQASGASRGDPASVKLIADAKGVLDDDDAQVISATPLLTGVQFGGESTLDYLEGAQKLSLRYELRGFAATVSFAGGQSMDGIIDKALKACGKASEPQASPRVGKDCSGIPMEQRTLDCAPQSNLSSGCDCEPLVGKPARCLSGGQGVDIGSRAMGDCPRRVSREGGRASATARHRSARRVAAAGWSRALSVGHGARFYLRRRCGRMSTGSAPQVACPPRFGADIALPVAPDARRAPDLAV